MKSLQYLLLSIVFTLIATTTFLEAAEKTPSREVLLVCPEVFRPAMKPWIDYRTKQGYQIRQISSKGTNKQIQNRIRRIAKQNQPAAILLIGDAAPPSATDQILLARSVPNFRVPAKVNIKFLKAAPHIGTDNSYADLDGDRMPDVPLGRLSVDTPKELSQVIKKVIAYESTPTGEWQRDISLIAGVGGFGKLVDSVIDIGARQLIQQLPDHYHVIMTQAAWRSPFCPTPARFPATTMQRLNDSPFFWVYIGHGNRARLDRLRMPNCKQRIMKMKDLDQLKNGQGRTIALMLACSTGDYDANDDSLAERMVATPGGPVAVMASSRVAMPYSMAVLANGMMRQLFTNKTVTLGQVFLSAKQEMVREESKDKNRMMIDQMARTFSPTRNMLPEERQEHVDLFNLFGDPLLQLPYPETIKLDVPETAKQGETIKITGTLPFDGQLTTELIRSRRRPDYAPAHRSSFPDTPEGLAAMQETYKKANQDHFHRQVDKDVKAGSLEMSITIPPTAPGGQCAVRIFLTNGKKSAAGSHEILITKQD